MSALHARLSQTVSVESTRRHGLDLSAVHEIVRDQTGGHALPAVALNRCVAVAIHRTAGHEIAAAYFAQMILDGQVRLGSLLYRGAPDLKYLKSLYGGSRLSTRPERLRFLSDESPVFDFAIANSELFRRFDVRFDYGCQELVDEIFRVAPGGRMAVGVPHSTKAEYTIPAPNLPAEQGNLFGVTPAHPDQLTRLRQITKFALTHRSVFLLFPELCTSPDYRDDLLRAIGESTDQACLVIAGSYHDQRTHRHELLGWMYWPLPGGKSEVYDLVHQKFNPLVVKDSQHAGGVRKEVVHPADIDPAIPRERPTIRVYCGTRHRLVALICADAICPEVSELLIQAGINVVLIPAMSETHGVFNHLADRMVQSTQGLTLIAMTPWQESGPSAMLRTPHRDTQSLWVGQSATMQTEAKLFHNSFNVPCRSESIRNGPRLGVPATCLFELGDHSCYWFDQHVAGMEEPT
ncbi:MAG TPA: hypothetical protein VHR66_24185 [Gemmataceae bacterium]|nr:hypothetical protein [Gemmataceae bacterium]